MLLRGKKGKFVLLFVVLFLCSVAMIVVHIVHRYQYYEKMQLPDLNGNDKSLSQITEQMIEENGYDQEYYALNRKVITKGTRSSSGITDHFADKDYPYLYTKFNKISGIYIGNAYLGEGKEVTFSVESSVVSGNLRIVLTNFDGKILYDVPIDTKATLTFFAESNEVYYLKYIAESAKTTIEVTRTTSG